MERVFTLSCVSRISGAGAFGFLQLLACQAEAALAGGVGGEAGEELVLAEVGPEHGREYELGVGALHEEEIADARLAGGADDEVGVGDAGGVEVAGEGVPGGFAGGVPAGGDGPGVGEGGVGDFGARAVVEGEDEGVFLVVGGGGDGGGELFLHGGRERARAADGAEGDFVFLEGFELALEEVVEEAHEAADLALRAVPVFGGEGIEGEVFYAGLESGGDCGAHGLGAAAVPLEAREAAPFCPAAVAVHDDGDVRGDRRGGRGLFVGVRHYAKARDIRHKAPIVDSNRRCGEIYLAIEICLAFANG